MKEKVLRRFRFENLRRRRWRYSVVEDPWRRSFCTASARRRNKSDGREGNKKPKEAKTLNTVVEIKEDQYQCAAKPE